MLIDANDLEDGQTIDTAIAIVGGGMAGIALARQLAEAGVEVVILESGGETPDARVQDLYAGSMTVGDGQSSVANDDYLTASRVRCFGGSGHVWGGKCGPLDPIDFVKRSWIPHSGWPVTRESLQPYYDRACALLELPRFLPPSTHPVDDPLLERRSAQFTPRTRAYTRYSGQLKDGPFKSYTGAAATHPGIRVYLHANVTRIALSANGRHVESLRIALLNGRRHILRAGTYILATGGIENVRLLLASNDVAKQGIGNHSDWLGRGFQGHTTISRDQTTLWSMRTVATLAPYDISRFDAPHRVLGLSDGAQARTRRLNFTVTMSSVVKDAPPTAVAVQAMARRLTGQTASAHHNIYFMTEHPPNRDSRITLREDSRDALGLPRVHLEMRHDPIEHETLERTLDLLARELGRLGVGRLQWSGTDDAWRNSFTSLSRHHMGATRMSSSAADGVVDEHGRVHGVANLYVAGSSVFPTSGLCNPTLTLLALGFRMGDTLLAGRGRTA